MKRALAIVLALTLAFTMALFGASVSAESAPKIFITDSFVKTGESTTLQLVATGFDTVAGMDLLIERSNSDVTFNGDIETTDLTLTKDENYVIEEGKIHIVEEFVTKTKNNTFTINIPVTASKPGNYILSLANSKFASDDEEILNVVVANGMLVVSGDASSANATDNSFTPDVGSNYFVPYGSAYYINGEGETVLLEKKADGTFVGGNGVNISGKTVNYQKFGKPAEGEAKTFGVSKDTSNADKLLFGSYINTKSDNSYGTLYVYGEGDNYDNLIDYYGGKGKSQSQVLKALANAYLTKLKNTEVTKSKDIDGHYRYDLTVTSADATVSIVMVDQKKVMWSNTGGTDLQYAVRINYKPSNKYAATAYWRTSKDDDYDTSNYIFAGSIVRY